MNKEKVKGMIEKCDFVWLTLGRRHVCNRIKGHSGPHRCEVCNEATEVESERQPRMSRGEVKGMNDEEYVKKHWKRAELGTMKIDGKWLECVCTTRYYTLSARTDFFATSEEAWSAARKQIESREGLGR